MYLFSRAILPATILLVCFAVYLPGSNGGFILDDYINLDKLGEFNGIRNLDTFGKYLSGGIAGPTGRPLSLLSFLLNAQNWPAEPLPFKLTNIIIHLGCGFLLYLLCRTLFFTLNQDPRKAETAALITTALWLLHPFFVSTVLYIVQRMAMLAAFFSLTGLWLYSHGRLMIADRSRRAYVYMTAGVGIGTVLAVLSKENGALLPLLTLCVEYCIYRHPRCSAKQLHPVWFAVFLLLPGIAVLAYLAALVDVDQLYAPIFNRDFNLAQRLLSESRIVLDYLYQLYIPRLSYPGILNDNFALSQDLTHPLSTLPAVLAMFFLPLAAFLARTRWPFFSLSVLFFLAGHLVESTVVPLELYFEHRNYLPAIFLFAPLGATFAETSRRLVTVPILALIAVCSLFTYQQSVLWGDNTKLALFWAAQNPDSVRAQRQAAIMLMEQRHDSGAALQILEQARKNHPENLELVLHWLFLKCRHDALTATDFDTAETALAHFPYTERYYELLEAVVTSGWESDCKGMDAAKGIVLLDLLADNPSVRANHAAAFQMHHLKGIIYAGEKNPLAAEEFAQALTLSGIVEQGMQQTAILAANGFLQQALAHLENTAKHLPNSEQSATRGFQMNYRYEIERLKQQIEQEIKETDVRAHAAKS